MSAAGAGSSGTGSSRFVKAGSFGSTSSSSTPLSLVSWSRTSSACSSVRASTPCRSQRSSSLVTPGTRRQAGCCQLDIQPNKPPRHFIGTPIRTLSLAINSLHLRGSKGRGNGGHGQARRDFETLEEGGRWGGSGAHLRHLARPDFAISTTWLKVCSFSYSASFHSNFPSNSTIVRAEGIAS